ncbi:thermonuclease family protein [uncultured Tateyamaria sp.]|uniref:thermonuclease family protein n=1 Tax=uncultured Tateyamaria sp. TaxID=455651 RepID=UPI002601CAA9|nr:thermonuclease family protein [uncultured Tateyamaria sp.]
MEILFLLLVLGVVVWVSAGLQKPGANDRSNRGGDTRPTQTAVPRVPSTDAPTAKQHVVPKPNPKSDHAPPPPIPSSMQLKGRAWVIDGDTIAINRIKIRLAGIDAPELDQPWGQKSKWEMVKLCKGQVITVKLTGETSYDRLVGTCFLPDGRDLGAEIISAGLALDGGHFSKGKYKHLEDADMRRKLKGYGRWR